RDTLDRNRHDLARALLPLLAGALFEVADGRHRFPLRFFHDLADERLLRLRGRHVRHALQALAMRLRGVLQLHPERLEAPCLSLEFLARAFELRRAALQRLLPLTDRSLATLDLLAAGADVDLRFLAHRGDLVLDLHERLADEGLRLSLGVEHELLRP